MDRDGSTSENTGAGKDAPPGVVKKAIAASAVGNFTEWFDYGLYAYGVATSRLRSSPPVRAPPRPCWR